MAPDSTPDTSPPVSEDDLYNAIDSLLGSNTSVCARDVPDLFSKVQDRQQLSILNEDQLAALRGYLGSADTAGPLSTLDLTREDIFGLVNQVKSISPGDAAQDPGPAAKSLPTLVEVATPVANKPARRRSTRIRTASDSSSTEDDELQTPSRSASSAGSKRPMPRRSFPDESSSYMLPSTIATSPDGALPPLRTKKLSDASNKFEQRNREEPPSSYVQLNRRPAPPNSRRGSAQFTGGPRSDDGHATFEYAHKVHGRSASSASVVSPSSRSVGATSPTSPPLNGYKSDEDEGLGGWRSGPGSPSMDHAFEKMKADEELRALNATIKDLHSRIQSLKHESDAAQQTHDDIVTQIQDKHDNELQELDSKAREHASRQDKKHQAAMEAKEQEIAELNEELSSAQSKLTDCQAIIDLGKQKAAELRDIIEERDRDINSLRMELGLAHDQREQVESDLGRSNEQNAELLEKLEATRVLEADLAARTVECNWLKSAIADMDKQLNNLKGGGSHSGGGLGSAGPATLTRNGGTQLSSELQAAEPQVQTVFRNTTHTITRTIHTGASPSTSSTYMDAGVVTEALDILHDPAFAEARQVLREQITAELEADAEAEGARTPVQSRSLLEEEALRSPPAYSAAPGPLDADALIKHSHPTHPKGDVRDEDLQTAYDTITRATGKRCHILEEELEKNELLRDKHDNVNDANGKFNLVGRVFNWASTAPVMHLATLALCTMLAAHALGSPPQRDPYDSFAMNGYVSWFDHTAAMVRAGRVPT